MPINTTITASDITTFIANTRAVAADVNDNFDVWRGHILPVNPNTSAAITLTYGLGSAEYRFATGYMQDIALGATTTSWTIKDEMTGTSDLVFYKNSVEVTRLGPGGLSQKKVTQPNITWYIGGTPNKGDQIVFEQLKYDIQITDAKLFVDEAGSSGQFTVDIEYKRGAGSWTSIFTTLPSIAHTASDFAESSNQAINTAAAALQADDFIRLNIDAVQLGGRNIIISIENIGA